MSEPVRGEKERLAMGGRAAGVGGGGAGVTPAAQPSAPIEKNEVVSAEAGIYRTIVAPGIPTVRAEDQKLEQAPPPPPLRAATLQEQSEYTRQYEEQERGIPPEKEFVKGILAPGTFSSEFQREKDWQKTIGERPYYYAGSLVSEVGIALTGYGLIKTAVTKIPPAIAKLKTSSIPTATPKGQFEMDVSKSSFLTTTELPKSQITITSYPTAWKPPYTGPLKVTKILPPSKPITTPPFEVTKLTEYGRIKGLTPEQMLSMRERGFDISKVRVDIWQSPTKQTELVLTKTGLEPKPAIPGRYPSSKMYFDNVNAQIKKDQQIYTELTQREKGGTVVLLKDKPISLAEPLVKPITTRVTQPIKTPPIAIPVPPVKADVFPTRGPTYPQLKPGSDIWSKVTRTQEKPPSTTPQIIPAIFTKYGKMIGQLKKDQAAMKEHTGVKTVQLVDIGVSRVTTPAMTPIVRQRGAPKLVSRTGVELGAVQMGRVGMTAPKVSQITVPRFTQITSPRGTQRTTPIITPRVTQIITPRVTQITTPRFGTSTYTPIRITRQFLPPPPPPFMKREKKRKVRKRKEPWRFAVFRNIPARPIAPKRPPAPTPSRRRL